LISFSTGMGGGLFSSILFRGGNALRELFLGELGLKKVSAFAHTTQ
jgi:hypothetical protein